MDGRERDREYRAYDPTCPPSWRAEDARRLARGRKARWSPHGDPHVAEYADFLRAIHPGQTKQDRDVVREKWPVISTAHRIYQRDIVTRWLLESYVVAGERDEVVARRCRAATEVVHLYVSLFFDVRPYLGATSWLQDHAVGDGVWNGFKGGEVRQFWAWCAMARGPLAVEYLARVLHEVLGPGERPHLGAYLRPDANIDPTLQATVASAVLPPFGPMGEKWGMLHLRSLEAQAAHDPDRGATMRDRVRNDLVTCARAHLSGKPLPSMTRLGWRPSKMQAEPAQDLREGTSPGREPRPVLGDPRDAHAEQSQGGHVSGANSGV